jgi:GH24 family phage-related lysozyme (muramidase)
MSDYDDRLRRQLMFEEGYQPIVYEGLPNFPRPPHGSYLDSAHPPRWTTGYGFNLQDPAAPKALAKVTTKTTAKLISRDELLTDSEALQLLDIKIADATSEARKSIKNFEKLSDARKLVVVCMAYQLAHFSVFKKFFAALEKGEFGTAAEEMRNSNWATQTENRMRRMYKAMKEDTFPPQSELKPIRQGSPGQGNSAPAPSSVPPPHSAERPEHDGPPDRHPGPPREDPPHVEPTPHEPPPHEPPPHEDDPHNERDPNDLGPIHLP